MQGGTQGSAEPAVHNAVGVMRAVVPAGSGVPAAHVRAQEPHQRLRLRSGFLPRQLQASTSPLCLALLNLCSQCMRSGAEGRVHVHGANGVYYR